MKPCVSASGAKHVDLEVAAHQIDRNLADRARLADAGVVEQDVDVPGLGVRDVVGIEQVELLDAQVLQAELLGLRRSAATCGEIWAVAMTL